jgi:hypothetical protein
MASVWQLQMLAEAYDVIVKTARRTGHTLLSASDRAEIGRSDAVVASMTKAPGDRARAEMEAARKSGKPIYHLVERAIADGLRGRSANVVLLEREEDIGAVARKVHDVIKREKASKEARTALGWLLGIGVALLVLGALAGENE